MRNIEGIVNLKKHTRFEEHEGSLQVDWEVHVIQFQSSRVVGYIDLSYSSRGSGHPAAWPKLVAHVGPHMGEGEGPKLTEHCKTSLEGSFGWFVGGLW